MDDFDDTLDTIFNTPICPTCATIFDATQYDDVDDCAYCSNCGTSYRIPDEYRPLHPEDALEHGFLDTLQSVALEQFRADAKRVSEAMMRQTAGGTYEMYERWFTEALEPYVEELDPGVRHHAIPIARNLGYIEDAEVLAAGFGPGLCTISGIDEHYCHCGRHP